MKNKMKKLVFQTGFFFLLVSSLLCSQQDKIRIACVGNSITEGNAMSTKLLDAYPIALGRYLGPGYDVRNFGVSGRTMLKKGDFPIWNEKLFSDAINFNPNIVTIFLGTNDSKPYNWIYKDDFMKDYYSMIDTFKQEPANPEIYICLPPPSFSDAYDIRDSVIVADIIPMIKKIADSAHVKLIDFNTPFLDKSYLMPDGIHPLIEGSDFMARILLKELTGKIIESQKEINAAFNKPCVQGNNYVSELTSGNAETGIAFSSLNEPVIINLLNETEVDLVKINFLKFSLTEIPFTIAVSKDSVDWLNVIDTTVAGTSLVKEDSLSKFVKTFSPVQAKYLKFQIKENGIPKDSVIYLNKIKVYESRAVHAPIIGWELVSRSAQSIRVKISVVKTSNVGEYIKIYRESKESDPFYIYSNYGSSVPLTFTSTIQNGVLNRCYCMVYFNGVEITSDTLTIINSKTTDIKGSLENISPSEYSLMQNYPNPFNPETFIEFLNTKPDNVSIEIFDITGRLVRTIGNHMFFAGSHRIRWDGINEDGILSASGIYFYRLKIAGKVIQMKKMMMLQ
jgi:acyl-CoA thioesterase-1